MGICKRFRQVGQIIVCPAIERPTDSRRSQAGQRISRSPGSRRRNASAGSAEAQVRAAAPARLEWSGADASSPDGAADSAGCSMRKVPEQAGQMVRRPVDNASTSNAAVQ